LLRVSAKVIRLYVTPSTKCIRKNLISGDIFWIHTEMRGGDEKAQNNKSEQKFLPLLHFLPSLFPSGTSVSRIMGIERLAGESNKKHNRYASTNALAFPLVDEPVGMDGFIRFAFRPYALNES
jgi:hypothetical protein